ncbi:hypothetical protein B7494_g7344 [Chlorociboria aeruginascens]|nr:hypothetical protein B7494_g7344 [Chlorociboria aeruginascens]
MMATASLDFKSNAKAGLDALQSWYNHATGLWDTTGWWNSANCLTTLGDLAAADSTVRLESTYIFANTWVQAQKYNLQMTKEVEDFMTTCFYAPSPAGFPNVPSVTIPDGFLNAYYDDEGWWALAWIQAFDITKNPQYLQTSEDIFEDMKKGMTTPCGGIWWDKKHTYVNAIANELFLSVAAYLANRTSKKQYYLDIATKQWQWFQESGMINSAGLINDGLTSNCKNNNGTVWSYNQGVILGALVELNKASPNQDYIIIAKLIANAAISTLGDSNGVLHDPCEPNCGADGTQFKGIFMRNLQLLQAVAPDDGFLNFIAANAGSIWINDRDADNRFGVVWSGPFVGPANASTQSSALDALVAAVPFQQDL